MQDKDTNTRLSFARNYGLPFDVVNTGINSLKFEKYLQLLRESADELLLCNLTKPGGKMNKSTGIPGFRWNDYSSDKKLKYLFRQVPSNTAGDESELLELSFGIIGVCDACDFNEKQLIDAFNAFLEIASLRKSHFVRFFVFEYRYQEHSTDHHVISTLEKQGLVMFPEEHSLNDGATTTLRLHMEVVLNTLSVAVVQFIDLVISTALLVMENGKCVDGEGQMAIDNFISAIISRPVLNQQELLVSEEQACVFKLCGDYSLLVNSSSDALQYYKLMLERAPRSTSSAFDLWYASALEGIAAAYTTEEDKRSIGLILKTSLAALEIFIENQDVSQEFQLLLKMAWSCCDFKEYTGCLDLINRLQLMAPDLSIDKKILLAGQSSLMCHEMKYFRKEVMYQYELGLLYQSIGEWNHAVIKLGYALRCTEQTAFDSVSDSCQENVGWRIINAFILEQLCLSSRNYSRKECDPYPETFMLKFLQLSTMLQKRHTQLKKEEKWSSNPTPNIICKFSLHKSFFELVSREPSVRDRSLLEIPESIQSLISNCDIPPLLRARSSSSSISSILNQDGDIDSSRGKSKKKGFVSQLSLTPRRLTPRFSSPSFSSPFASMPTPSSLSAKKVVIPDEKEEVPPSAQSSGDGSIISQICMSSDLKQLQKSLIGIQEQLVSTLSQFSGQTPAYAITAAIEDLPLTFENIIVHPSHVKVPEIWISSLEKQSSSDSSLTFFYSPFDDDKEQINLKKQEGVKWLQSQICHVDITMSNPLSIPLCLEKVSLSFDYRTGDSPTIESFDSSFTIAPRARDFTMSIACKPLHPSSVRLKGVRVCFFQFQASRECDYSIDIIPSHPFLDTVPISSCFACPLQVLAGEITTVRPYVRNCSTHVIHALRIVVVNQRESKETILYNNFDKFELGTNNDLQLEKLMSQLLPIQPHQQIEFPVELQADNGMHLGVFYADHPSSDRCRELRIPCQFDLQKGLQVVGCRIQPHETKNWSNSVLRNIEEDLYKDHLLLSDHPLFHVILEVFNANQQISFVLEGSVDGKAYSSTQVVQPGTFACMILPVTRMGLPEGLHNAKEQHRLDYIVSQLRKRLRLRWTSVNGNRTGILRLDQLQMDRSSKSIVAFHSPLSFVCQICPSSSEWRTNYLYSIEFEVKNELATRSHTIEDLTDSSFQIIVGEGYSDSAELLHPGTGSKKIARFGQFSRKKISWSDGVYRHRVGLAFIKPGSYSIAYGCVSQHKVMAWASFVVSV